MKLFADLVDRLDLAARADLKAALLADYFRRAPNPDRGAAISLLLDDVAFDRLSPAMTRKLAVGRVDPVLFDMSRDFVGDLGETTALMWSARASNRERPSLHEILATLHETSRADLVEVVESWLDTMEAGERRVLLKLAARRIGVGVSPMVIRKALALFGGIALSEIEEVWHAQTSPYTRLFDWLEGREERPGHVIGLGFKTMMQERPSTAQEVGDLDLSRFIVEWKRDGLRVQISARGEDRRLFSAAGDDISSGRLDVLTAFTAEGVFDAVLQRGSEDGPRFVWLLDLLVDGSEDIRHLPLEARRGRLEKVIVDLDRRMFGPSERQSVEDRAGLARHHAECRARGALGLVLKHRDGRYVAGLSTDDWFSRERDPLVAEFVLMYLHHHAGGRTCLGREATFGAWRQHAGGSELVPVAKAEISRSLGPVDELDRWISEHARKRFGPVTEVAPELAMTLSFDAVERASRRKAGLVLRGPRVISIAWEKSAAATTRVETLEAWAD